MTDNGKRLIEDYLPIEAISKEASREKSTRKAHISTLHTWWARRPLVACRAAVYGALVPASRFSPKNGPEEKRISLTRANAARFVDRLCKFPGDASTIAEAQRHILEAHADQLTKELGEARTEKRRVAWIDEFEFYGERVSVDDIIAGRAPRPRVLDMFAGGGAIPLEALRLGCEAFAIELNPVAYIIELCTLVYPQKYGKPEPNGRGMTGPKNAKGETTWGGLANEVQYWGNWVLQKVKADIADIYPLIRDPEFKQNTKEVQTDWLMNYDTGELPNGYLLPVAYIWTRTVLCKNPSCRATVPLVRQTWLCRKDGRYVALRIIRLEKEKRLRFDVVEARSEKGLEFNPAEFSKAGSATCLFCGTVAESDYIKEEGNVGRIETQLMAVVCTRIGSQQKVYLSANAIVDENLVRERINALCDSLALTIPKEPLPKPGTLGFRVQPYGFKCWSDLFIPRQILCLVAFVAAVRKAQEIMGTTNLPPEHACAVTTYLGLLVDRLAAFGNSLSGWNYHEQAVANVFGRQALPMVWDFAEVSPFADISGGIEGGLIRVVDVIGYAASAGNAASVQRASALNLPFESASMDAIVTDPPYYDNVPYADLSDFFYVWLKRTVGQFYSEHFASELSPKKAEAIADPSRHGGSKEKARQVYEAMMGEAFREAQRVLKPNGEMVVVYAHKTTLGWTTLVDALRGAGLTVTEAWPLDTEYSGRLRKQNSAALASSIFLVARKREKNGTGNYENEVQRDLEEIVRERVETLWEMGVSGADLVIASVGAGLRAFTRFARVEYANGDEVPAERFLSEVESVVLDTILARLSKDVGTRGVYSLAGVDAITRFYILWRYTYKSAELEAGEAIIFSNGAHVELDGSGGLSAGARALIEKKKGRYRLLEYAERGSDDKLGMPDDDSQPVPLIDALHRTLWLMENRPGRVAQFLQEAQPNREQMRLVAQALAGPALKGGELANVSPSDEMAVLGKLTANWRSVIEDQTLPLFR